MSTAYNYIQQKWEIMRENDEPSWRTMVMHSQKVVNPSPAFAGMTVKCFIEAVAGEMN
jgi:hypothetical protein